MSAAVYVLPADHAERERALDPERSFIVQAPAGSGKTELLIQRYLALLAHVEQPESVLAITFTRKAAGEMRARVLDALRRAAGESEPAEPNARRTWRLARAALEADERGQWNVGAAPSRLRIETIDALCLRIARRMPWLARFGGMPGIVEDARELYAEAARNTLLLLGDEQYGPAVEKLALHLDNDLERATRLLETMLEKRDQWLRRLGAGAGDPNLRAALEGMLTAIVEEGIVALRDALPANHADDLVLQARYAGKNLEREHPDHPLVRCANLTRLPGGQAQDIDVWLALSHLVLTGNGEWRKSADKRLGFPAAGKKQKQQFTFLLGQLARCDGLLQRFADLRKLPAPRYTDRQWEFLESLFALLPVAAAQLKVAFQRRGVVDFIELNQAAQRALGSPDDPTDLGLAFGHRIEHVLVDEVQDTSLTQIRLLESLIAGWGEGRTLFLVGDPMQSIYRFREAEVGLFLAIRRSGLLHLSPEPLTLRVNFRSRADLVDWVNANLSSTFPGIEDIRTGAVPYCASAPFRPAAATRAVHVHPFVEEDPGAEARLVADIVEQSRRELPSSSIAILVRARTHLPEIALELQRRGHAFRAVEIDLLAERPAVRDLLAITRAILHPADRIAWLAILRAPWCGLTLAELHAVASSDGYTPVWDLLSSTLQDHPRLARVREAMARAANEVRRVPLRECVERAWISLGGPSCLDGDTGFADAQRFLALLEEMDRGGEIEALDLLETRVSRLFGDPNPTASGELHLMTIHKAKGLEFDTVIVPGLGYGAGQEDQKLLYWAEAPSGRGSELLFAPVESKEDERDPTCQYVRRLEREKSELESARLLYVACTRARERLHLVGHTQLRNGDSGEPELSQPRYDSLLRCLWPRVEAQFQRALETRASAEAGDTAAAQSRTLRRLPDDWRAPEQTAGLAWGGAGRDTAAAAGQVTFEWVGDTLRHVGTVVHSMLERIARDGLETWDAARIEQRIPAMRNALASLGVPPAELDGAIARAARAVLGAVRSDRGRWVLTGRAIEACEFTASFQDEGVVRQVAVDRTFVDEHGIRWIIDYKTSDHLGSDTEAFLDNEIERYRDQLETYARLFAAIESRPIRCGLYFPMLDGWREWRSRRS